MLLVRVRSYSQLTGTLRRSVRGFLDCQPGHDGAERADFPSTESALDDVRTTSGGETQGKRIAIS
jgi:hypothetical protein